MKKYEISVVTPFHNVNLDFFRAGVASMKAQTYGFENIEWIVVVHNCDQEYKDGVHELLDGYENVIIKELDNDKRTPSSPRNCGMDLATGDYIGFLDGDDSYTPECMEVVLEAIKRNKAQVATFRREYEMEDPNGNVVTELMLFDQIEKEILIDRDHWDDRKMFSGLFGLVTSRIYDRNFLEEIHLRFDESVLFAEDFLFNLEVYGHLDRVLYLPQFIGYHYFINGGSLVQSGDKSPETLLTYTKGYVKVFSTGLKYNFYMNSIISRHCLLLSRFFAASRSLTLEQRLEIRDLLAPFIERTTLMEPTKVYSAKMCKAAYEIPRSVIMNPEEWLKHRDDTLLIADSIPEDALEFDDGRTLSRILEKNQNTDMGRHYGFWDIMTIDQYRRSLPLSDYTDLGPLVRLTTGIGEQNIFTAEEIAAYVGEEAADGSIHIFPMTGKQIYGNARVFSKQLTGHRSFLMPDKVKGGKTIYNDAANANTVASAVTDALLSHTKGIVAPELTAPEKLFFCSEDYDTRYLHMLFALRDSNLEQIFQPKCRYTLHLFRYIEENWKMLCDDIEHGTVSAGLPVPKELEEMLFVYLQPDAKRAAELRAVFEEGFETPVAGRIWPRLSGVYTNKDRDDDAWKTLKERYLGDIRCTDVFFEACGTVTGMRAYSGKENVFQLVKQSAFYEFIPVADMDKDGKEIETKLSHQLEKGSSYEMVLTTGAGLYRFRTGKVITIEELNEESILFSQKS